MYVVEHNTLSDSFRIQIVWFQPKQDSNRIQIRFFKNRIGSDSKNPLSDRLWLGGIERRMVRIVGMVGLTLDETPVYAVVQMEK